MCSLNRIGLNNLSDKAMTLNLKESKNCTLIDEPSRSDSLKETTL